MQVVHSACRVHGLRVELLEEGLAKLVEATAIDVLIPTLAQHVLHALQIQAQLARDLAGPDDLA